MPPYILFLYYPPQAITLLKKIKLSGFVFAEDIEKIHQYNANIHAAKEGNGSDSMCSHTGSCS